MDIDTILSLLADDPQTPLDLAEVALVIAREEYPNLDIEAELSEINAMAREVKPRLRGGLSVQVEALVRYLFHEQGFTGNQRDYYDPRNSYLNEVLQRRTGLPISLSIIAISVASRAGLEVVGVGLPGHFIAKAVQRDQEVFFDPFHGGRILRIEDCQALVQSVVGSPYEPTPDALAAVSLGYIVLRMLTNLKACYLGQQDYARAARVIGRLRQLCPDDAMQQRDLGATLLQGGKAGQAVDHLRAYLAQEPPPMDARSVRELLGQAEAEVARWN